MLRSHSRVYSSMVFNLLRELCNAYHCLNFRTFPSNVRNPVTTKHSLPICPFSKFLVTTNPPVSVALPVLDFSHWWIKHTVHKFTVVQDHTCCGMHRFFIPFYCQIMFHCIADYILLIHFISWRIFFSAIWWCCTMLVWMSVYKILSGCMFSILPCN
jgi:hypothetical protein